MPSSTKQSEPNAPLKPIGKSSTPSTTGPALPSRDLFSAADGAATFTYGDTKGSHVDRARQIEKSDGELYKNIHNFFTATEEPMARKMDGKFTATKTTIYAWVCDSFGPDVEACIKQHNETKECMLTLIIVSTALAKYDEEALYKKHKNGELDKYVCNRYHTYWLRSPEQQKFRMKSRSKKKGEKHTAHVLGLGFVLSMDLALPAGNRVGSKAHKEILSSSYNMRIVPKKANQKLHRRVDKALNTPSTPDEAENWTEEERSRILEIIKVAQCGLFQNAMIETGGAHLYDAIRNRLKQAGDSWDNEKDKPALTREDENIPPRETDAAKVKPMKDAELKKKGRIKSGGASDRRDKDNKALPSASIPATPAETRQVLPPEPIAVKHPTTTTSAEGVHLPSEDEPDTSSGSNSSSGNTKLYRGLRGGTFYCNSKGNRSYVRVGDIKELYTGPRGGKYYFNAKGNKAYVNRRLLMSPAWMSLFAKSSLPIS